MIKNDVVVVVVDDDDDGGGDVMMMMMVVMMLLMNIIISIRNKTQKRMSMVGCARAGFNVYAYAGG